MDNRIDRLMEKYRDALYKSKRGNLYYNHVMKCKMRKMQYAQKELERWKEQADDFEFKSSMTIKTLKDRLITLGVDPQLLPTLQPLDQSNVTENDG